jgi:hypothetical protein
LVADLAESRLLGGLLAILTCRSIRSTADVTKLRAFSDYGELRQVRD